MIGNPYPQFQNVQEWNDLVNEVRNALAQSTDTIAKLYALVEEGGGGGTVPDASATVKGKMKLYPSTGNNLDGTITQRGITTAIDSALDDTVSMTVMSVSIPTTGWTASGLQGFAYTVTITGSTITADMLPTLIVSDADWSKAVACQLAPFCETIAGGLKIYANSIPSTAINARVILESAR